MIDMHLHAVSPRLPGVTLLPEFLDGPPTTVGALIRDELAAVGVTHVLAMGHLDGDEDDPLGVASSLAIAEHVPGMGVIGVADPRKTDTDHLARVAEQLRRPKLVAFKAYLGYLPFGPDAPEYRPYYDLAAAHEKPVIFHTGDTYARRAKVRFAHPLLVDEVAVDFPDVRFVMAHFGNPWLIDAAEVVYKNENVWADLSGLLVGDAEYFSRLDAEGILDRIAARVWDAMEYCDKPDRFLYGVDWPLAPMPTYRDFLKRIVPETYWPAFFHHNAAKLFGVAASANLW